MTPNTGVSSALSAPEIIYAAVMYGMAAAGIAAMVVAASWGNLPKITSAARRYLLHILLAGVRITVTVIVCLELWNRFVPR